MQETPKTHNLTLLLTIWFAAAVILTAGISLLAIVMSVTRGAPGELSTNLYTAVGLGTAALLMIPALYFSARRIRGRDEPAEGALRPSAERLLLVLPPILWGLILALSGMNFSSPLLTPLAFGLPVFWLVYVALRKQTPLPRWQAWGVFGLGLSATPLILIILELIALAGIVFLAVLFNPDLTGALQNLGFEIRGLNDPEQLTTLLSPYIIQPGVLLAVFAMVSVLGPLLEEAIKPLGVWLLAGEIRSPGHGFLLGALSGAAYSLFEGLGNSGLAGSDWALLAVGRTGTSLMHILTSGLVGWGLVLAFRERRFLRLAGLYALSVILHGIWNAISILSALGTIAAYSPDGPQLPAWLRQSSIGLVVLAILALGLYWLASGRAARTQSEQQV